MLRVVTNITIKQRANTDFPNRDKTIRLDYLADYSWTSRWLDLTDKGSITIPRRITCVDEFGAAIPLYGNRVNIGGFTKGVDPLFMRGDKITLSSGYLYKNDKGVWIKQISGSDVVPALLDGYISKVYSKTPIQFDIEDNMWILKQTAMSNQTFSSSDTLEDILKLICSKVYDQHKITFTSTALTQTNIGQFMVQNETAAQLLNRLNRLFGFHAYFRGNELRCGVLVYDIKDFQRHTFIMNGPDGNVCADGQDLEYQRREDVVLSARAYNTIEESTGATCKDGSQKTKRTRIEVLVTFDNANPNGLVTVIPKGEHAAEAMEGERRTFFYPGAKTTTELGELAKEELKKYYYTGLKGKFKAFGIPFVRHGDHVEIINPEQPEQNGVYMVKGVEYSGSPQDALKQLIELDFRIIS